MRQGSVLATRGVNDRPPSAMSAPPVLSCAPMTTHRALIVEDDPSLAALMGRLLARVSVGSTAVGTVAAAEGALAEGRFDVIVLDPNLPDGDGLALLTSLRARGVLTPAVIVSGAVVSPPDARCLALVKPFTKDALPDAVLTLLEPL